MLLVGARAWAFPEMTRHGYTHCTACHTNLVGGGMLNEYGRSLSKELLSQQTMAGVPNGENEEKLLYGLLKTPDWLTLGGDLRVLQTFVDSKQASRGRFMIMQVDVEGSAQLSSRWRVFAGLGRIEPRASDPVAEDFVASTKHGVEYAFTSPEQENRITLRAGRFTPAYGIAVAEHPFVTRNEFQLFPGMERYAAELGWITEKTSLIGTAIFSQADGADTTYESGGIIQAATGVREKSKIGINYYQSTREERTGNRVKRKVYGLYSHIGFSEKFYGLLEFNRMLSASNKWGFMDLLKLGYEIDQGLHFIVVQEFLNRDTDQPSIKYESYGVGAQWFPRPHWDFYGLYRQARDTSRGNDFQQEIWLIGHFYL